MMNMCVIDITHIPAVKQGDVVTIIGKDKTEEVTTDEFASLAGAINYEVVTRLNPTIERKITGLQKKAK
jgi:alanine racemase